MLWNNIYFNKCIFWSQLESTLIKNFDIFKHLIIFLISSSRLYCLMNSRPSSFQECIHWITTSGWIRPPDLSIGKTWRSPNFHQDWSISHGQTFIYRNMKLSGKVQLKSFPRAKAPRGKSDCWRHLTEGKWNHLPTSWVYNSARSR